MAVSPRHVVIIDDEPAVCDVMFRVVARYAPSAIVTVLHSLDLARRVADACALLDDGELRAFGTPDRVIHDDHVHPAYEVRLLENAALGYFTDGEHG